MEREGRWEMEKGMGKTKEEGERKVEESARPCTS